MKFGQTKDNELLHFGSKLRTIDLFAGIGGIRLGFDYFGCKNVFTSEIDVHAQSMYAENFGEVPFGDINDIEPSEIPDHDILLGGFPCQAFSIAGKGLGFEDTRGTLFFNIVKILKAKRPKAFLLENIKRLRTHDKNRTFGVILNRLESLGYTVHYKILNTLDFGLPQKRERIYIIGFDEETGFTFPKPAGQYKPLSEILEPESDIPESFYLTERIRQKRYSALKKNPVYPSIWHENIGGNISPLAYSCALRAAGSHNYLVVNGERRLTGREMLRLQGFPENFKINVSYTQVKKIAGNSVSVPVITRLAEQMLKSLAHRPELHKPAHQMEFIYAAKSFSILERSAGCTYPFN